MHTVLYNFLAQKVLQKFRLKGTMSDPGPLNVAVLSHDKLASQWKRLPEELNDRLVKRLEFHESAYKRIIGLTPIDDAVSVTQK